MSKHDVYVDKLSSDKLLRHRAGGPRTRIGTPIGRHGGDATCCTESRCWPSPHRGASSRSRSLTMVGAAIFGIPVAKSLSAGGFQDPTSESARATQLLTDKFHQGDMQLVFTVTAPGRRQQCRGARGGTGHRRRGQGFAARRQRDLGVDVTAAGRRGPGEQGRQVRPDHRGHHRRRERRAAVRPGARRRRQRFGTARTPGRHGARRRLGDGVLADQQPERARSAADGVHRDSAELPGAGVGVRRPAGRGAADGGRRAGDRRARCRCCGSSPSPPTCRSSR